ncbi:hypothetical protein VOI32_14000 [Paraburkholderia caribensis]|uniref:Uncharacterized protein n=1 Tax=Paraburkholderia caribensis TaxID=75105 RepID=A0ABV0DVK8_9BURK|nr:hypothetical protein [Paraburkholderia caribensis]MCO4881558.1 hypothetical protein [Paraburkholderia caribensis]PTB24487.1 hypothetical protein C9I56_33530 [Paraburkholderia caribensis]
MAVTAEQIHTQIKSAIDAIPKPSAKESDIMVTVHMAKDFNRLLGLAKEAMPDVDERRWPDALRDAAPPADPGRSNVTFMELRTLYGQLLGILSEGVDVLGFGIM